MFRYVTFPHVRRYLELGALFGTMFILQNFDFVFTITSGGLGTANLPYTIYQTFFSAHDYGLASAQGVVVVVASLILATFALRVVSSLLKRGGNPMTAATAGRVARPATLPRRRRLRQRRPTYGSACWPGSSGCCSSCRWPTWC